jgi:aldose sugar dehydrogenase
MLKVTSLCSGSVLLIFAACANFNEAGPKPTSSESPHAITMNQDRMSVTQIYNQNCVNCHGQNGEGGGAGTKSLLTKEKFDQKYDKPFFDSIKKGVPEAAMQAFGESLTDEQIWGLVVRIREFQGKALRAEFGSPKAVNGVYSSQHHKFKVETVVDQGLGLKTPWGIDWLPDGKMLVTNRPGSVVVVDGSKVTEIKNLPATQETGQGGMMDVAVLPGNKSNPWIYLSFTDAPQGGNGFMTKIVRGHIKFSGDTPSWSDQQTIFEVSPEFYGRASHHFGSRIVLDGKGHVFFTIGERGGNLLAQEITNPYGKTYRLNEDGTIPSDNPFVNQVPADKPFLKGIWTFGHRNPQGLAMNAKGELWDTEHGPRGGDEVNHIVKGANYGWSAYAWSINYNDMPDWSPWPKDGKVIKQPIFRWMPSTGACGLDVAKGKAFPKWNGDLLAGGLVGQNLDRIRTDGDKLVEREELIHGMGRIRDVSVGPDGSVYIALNQPDKIIRLVPAE